MTTTHANPDSTATPALGAVHLTLRVEGALLAAAAVWGYFALGASGWLFAGLFLVPDVALLAFLGPNRRLASSLYNLTHNLALPAALGAFGLIAGAPLAVSLALIWVAHIGFDRAIGYGLKYPDSFETTHLQRV